MDQISKEDRRRYYIVQFNEPPFEGESEYIIVPRCWIEMYTPDQKVIVAYPDTSNPEEVRNLAKKRTKTEGSWHIFRGTIVYKTNSFKDAEQRLATGNYSTLAENSERNNQPETALNRNSPRTIGKSWSTIIPVQSSTKSAKRYNNPRKPLKRLSIKIPKGPRPPPPKRDFNMRLTNPDMKYINNIYGPGWYTAHKEKASTSKDIEQSVQCKQAEDKISSNTTADLNLPRADLSNPTMATELEPLVQQHTIIQQTTCEQLPSMPIIDLTESDDSRQEEGESCIVVEKEPSAEEDFTNIQKHEPHSVFKSSMPTTDCDSKLKELLLCEMPDVLARDIGSDQKTRHDMMNPFKVSKPINRVNKPQLYQETQLSHTSLIPHASKNLYSNSQLKKPDGIKSAEGIQNDQGPLQFTSEPRPPSLKVSSTNQLYEQLQGNPSLSDIIYSNDNKKSRETTSKNVSNPKFSTKSTVQHNLAAPPTAVRQVPSVAQNCCQQVLKEPEMNVRKLNITNTGNTKFIFRRNENDSQELQRESGINVGSTNENSNQHRFYNQNIAIDPSATQIPRTSHSFLDKYEQQHLPSQNDHLQQILKFNQMLGKFNEAQILNQIIDAQNDTARGLQFLQNQVYPIVIQPNQLIPQQENENLLLHNTHYQQLLKEEELRRLTAAAHIDHRSKIEIIQNIRIPESYAAQNISHALKLSNDCEPPQRRQSISNQQVPQKYSCTSDIGVGSKNHKSDLQGATKRTQLIQQSSLSIASDEMSESLLTVQKNYTEKNMSRETGHQKTTLESSPITKNLTVQSTSSNHAQQQKQQFTPIHENLAYIHPFKKIIVVNRTTNTDVITENTHFNGGTSESFAVASSSTLMDSVCQVNDYLLEKSPPPCQEVISDYKVVANEQIVSNSTESTPVEVLKDVEYRKKNTEQSNKEDNPTAEKKPIRIIIKPTNQKLHPRVLAEKQMLEEISDLMLQMSTGMSAAVQMFDGITTSMTQTHEIHASLLQAGRAFNEMRRQHVRNFTNAASSSENTSVRNSTNTASTSSNATSGVTEQNQTVQTKTKNTNESDKYNSNDIDEAPKKTNRLIHTFVLPSEYDSKDSKWTLKYRGPMPGLVELRPKTGIYVDKLKLAQCKRLSMDCKTFARMLLTEVFTESALGVCSFTGVKPNAFPKPHAADVRPGLDEHARMVLLAYVDEYGRQKKWEISMEDIIKTIRSKIQDLRAKYRKATE